MSWRVFGRYRTRDLQITRFLKCRALHHSLRTLFLSLSLSLFSLYSHARALSPALALSAYLSLSRALACRFATIACPRPPVWFSVDQRVIFSPLPEPGSVFYFRGVCLSLFCSFICCLSFCRYHTFGARPLILFRTELSFKKYETSWKEGKHTPVTKKEDTIYGCQIWTQKKTKNKVHAWENCVTSYHLISKTLHSCNCDCESPSWTLDFMIAFITWNSNLELLLEGLYSWNPCRFEFTVAWGFAGFACRHRDCGFPPQFGRYWWFQRAFLLTLRVLDSFLKSCPLLSSYSLPFPLSSNPVSARTLQGTYNVQKYTYPKTRNNWHENGRQKIAPGL